MGPIKKTQHRMMERMGEIRSLFIVGVTPVEISVKVSQNPNSETTI